SRQLSASESAFAEEPVQTTCQMEEPSHPMFETGADDQPIVQTSQHPKWFSQPRRPPSPDHDWNKTLPATQGDAQSWISKLARQTDARSSFNELLNTPIDFSNFIMNWLSIATLTPELLADTSITPPTTITTPTTTVAVTPRLIAAAKGKQPAKAKSLSDPSELARTEAQQLKIVLRRSRH
nr:hypothetical protein [Tanacetum cinerariifolium]